MRSSSPPAGPAARRLRLAAAALAVAVVLAGGLAAGLGYQRAVAAGRDSAARGAVAAASTAAQAIFSYDYRTFGASVATGSRYTTGAFAGEYARTTAALRATAVSEQAVVQAQVSAVGVIDTTGRDVTVLVYLNQYRRNSNISGEKVDQSRVVLTLVRVGPVWKVAAASAI